MSTRAIQPLQVPPDAVMRLAGAKSVCHRAALAAALARGSSVLSNFLFADDTLQFLDGLGRLGISIATDRAEARVEIKGCGGHIPACDADLDCRESGTMLRFLTALCATAVGDYRLFGRPRLHERPLAPLIRGLRQLGAVIEFEEREDHAPLIVHGRGLRGGTVQVDGSRSSQFASALLLAGPCAHNDLMLAIGGRPVSMPYVRMTCELMKTFEVSTLSEDFRRIVVPAPQQYAGTNITIEPDASTAGYFLAAAAVCGGRVRIAGLGRQSCQGDLGLVELLRRMGCDTRTDDHGVEVARAERTALHGLRADLGDMPDAVPTLAVLALFAEGPTQIRNVAHLKDKESDRLQVLASQLPALGADIELHDDGLTIHPPARVRPAELDPSGDHRLAMAFALVGLKVPGVHIRDAACVSKSYPDYFTVLCSLDRG